MTTAVSAPSPLDIQAPESSVKAESSLPQADWLPVNCGRVLWEAHRRWLLLVTESLTACRAP
jgi:hypothetical protein